MCICRTRMQSCHSACAPLSCGDVDGAALGNMGLLPGTLSWMRFLYVPPAAGCIRLQERVQEEVPRPQALQMP